MAVPDYADLFAAMGGTAATGLRAYVAFAFLAAGLGKLRHPQVFEGELADYRLLPAGAVAPAARTLPFVELALGAALLLPPLAVPAAYLAAALLAVFAAAVAANLRRGRRDISCGCGGAGRPISETLVVSNLALAALLAGSASLLPPGSLLLAAGAVLTGGGAFVVVQVFATMRGLAGNPARRAEGRNRA